MDRKLASIQKITDIRPIDGADQIMVADVLGWHVVIKKDEFKINDLCVYCEVDSIMPEKPEFEFLKAVNYKIKTRKFRKQISQGICFPLSVVPLSGVIEDGLVRTSLLDGDDVTEILGVTKYEPQDPVSTGGQMKGTFPGFIPKTDETRIQSEPKWLSEYAGTKCYITEKVDGCSATMWILNNEFGIASRNNAMQHDSANIWSRVAISNSISEKLSLLGNNVAIQGEILGHVQGNKYKLTNDKFYAFNLYDIKGGQYYDFEDFLSICDKLEIKTVPILEEVTLNHTVDDLVELSKGKSKVADIHREGIVIRSVKPIDSFGNRLSFKVINPEFLLKYNE